MIARLQRCHPGADFTHDAGAFVTQNAREYPFAVKPVERVGIGVAHTGRHNFDQDFTGARAFEIDFDNFQWLFGLERDSGAGFHETILPRG